MLVEEKIISKELAFLAYDKGFDCCGYSAFIYESKWYNKDGLWLFMQNFDLGSLSVNWTSFWLVLNEKYNLDFDEIEQLLTKLLYKYTNNGELEITL